MNIRSNLIIMIYCLGMGFSQLAYSSGYELPIQYSAEYSPLTAAVTSYVVGPQSMNFNVAGMAGEKGGEIEMTLAPLFSKKKGPYTQGVVAESDLEMATPFTVNYKYGVSRKLSFGIGTTYLGTSLDKKNQDFSSIHSSFANYKPSDKQNFFDTEISLGVAYAPIPGLKVGWAWRVAIMSAHLESNSVAIYDPGSVATGVPSEKIYGLTHLELDKMKDIALNGYRLGLQYAPRPKSWGVGLAFRSKMDFKLKGKVKGKVFYSAPFSSGRASSADLVENDASMKSHVPMQIQLGSHYYIKDNWVGLFNYSFTNYSEMGPIEYTGNIIVPDTILGQTVTNRLPNIPTHWRDFHTFALASEYQSESRWAYRGGVMYMSQVVDDYAGSFSTVTPGGGIGVTTGVGKKDIFKGIDLNFGLAYARFKGNIEKSDQNINRPTIGGTAKPYPGYDGLHGEFTTDSFLIFMGGHYHF